MWHAMWGCPSFAAFNGGSSAWLGGVQSILCQAGAHYRHQRRARGVKPSSHQHSAAKPASHSAPDPEVPVPRRNCGEAATSRPRVLFFGGWCRLPSILGLSASVGTPEGGKQRREGSEVLRKAARCSFHARFLTE